MAPTFMVQEVGTVVFGGIGQCDCRGLKLSWKNVFLGDAS